MEAEDDFDLDLDPEDDPEEEDDSWYLKLYFNWWLPLPAGVDLLLFFFMFPRSDVL